jgi:plastocyanin
VTRKRWSLPLALGLVAFVLAGCAPPIQPTFPVAAKRFVPQTVDFLSDAGRSPSMAVDSDGLPHLAYLGLNEKLAEGEIAPARPLVLPFIPAVLTSDLTKDGVWNHGAVIATKDLTKPLPLKKTDEVALALDGDGNGHVAFTETGDLKYSAQASGAYGDPDVIAKKTSVEGLSIAVDAGGTPWVSWLGGGRLNVATKQGKSWRIEDVAKASSSGAMPARTSIQAGSDGLIVAYTDADGQGPMLARRGGGGWSTEAIDPGGGGFAISLALDDGGSPHTAYYTAKGEVRHAHSVGGSPWEVSSIGQAGTEHPAGWSASIALDKKGTHYIAWYDSSEDLVRLATNASGDFKEIAITGNQAGELPRVSVPSDGSAVYVAWYDHLNKDLVLGTYYVNGPPKIALAAVSAAPSGGASPPPAETCKPTGTDITIVAPAGASASGFDKTCFAAPAGTPFTIKFDNSDPNVPHNVDVYDSLGGDHLFGAQPTEILTGPGTVTYKVGPQDPGSYYFQCDVHPGAMFGTFVIAK